MLYMNSRYVILKTVIETNRQIYFEIGNLKSISK